MSNSTGKIYRTYPHPWYNRVLLLVFFSTLVIGCSGLKENPIPHVSVAEIVQMSKTGEADAVIIDKIRNSGTVYNLSASQLANLRDNDGVSDAVIDYMQQTYIEAVRLNQQLNDLRFWTPYYDGFIYGGYPFGWNRGWYPVEPYPPFRRPHHRKPHKHDKPNKND